MHGTLIELFDCRQELYTATEVVANNSLFHVVVSRGGGGVGCGGQGLDGAFSVADPVCVFP